MHTPRQTPRHTPRSSGRPAARSPRGFTLMELMIVVAIVGILAAIAYPSFTEQARKARRADCAGTLLQNANALERFFTVNNRYNGAGTPALINCPADGGAATYTVTTPVITATTYTLRADPVGAQAADRCGALTLTHTGVKGVAGATAGLTWENCW